MKVSILEATDNADRLICAAARGDYLDRSLVGIDLNSDEDYVEIMDAIEGETLNDKTKNLIKDLLRKGHFGCAEHPSITFAIQGVSRACMAQLTRHRHASFDVQSMRYVDFSDPEMIEPPSISEEEVVDRKEGVIEFENDRRKHLFIDSIEDSLEKYHELLDEGVPKEDARAVLPIATGVNMTVTVNVRTLLHIANLRAKADAQSEIRDLTNLILNKAEQVAPITMEVWDEVTPMQISP